MKRYVKLLACLIAINVWMVMAGTFAQAGGRFDSLLEGWDYPQDGSRYTVLVLDVSGSMRGEPLEYLKGAADKFCSSMTGLEKGSYTAIATFGDYADLPRGFTDSYDLLKGALLGLEAYGGTELTDGMELAHEMLQRVPSGANITKNIIIFSDGVPANKSSAKQLFDSIESQYNIYTLGFFQGTSDSAAAEFLKSIQNSGFWEVTDLDKLDFAFGDVADQITGGDIKKLFVNQHISYINSLDYSNEISSKSPLYYDATMQAINDDLGMQYYDIVSNLSSWLNLDLAKALDHSTEYQLAFEQLMMNEQTLNGLSEDFDNNFVDILLDYARDVARSLLDSSDEQLQQKAGEIESEAKAVANAKDSDTRYSQAEELFKSLDLIFDNRNSGIWTTTLDRLFNETNGVFKGLGSGFFGGMTNIVNLENATFAQISKMALLGKSYEKTTDDFDKLLGVMQEVVDKEDLLNYTHSGQKPVMFGSGKQEIKDLKYTISNFRSFLDEYKQNALLAVMSDSTLTMDIKALSTVANQALGSLVGDPKVGMASPVIAGLQIARMALNSGLSLIDFYTGVGGAASNATMFSKMYYMNILLDRTAENLSQKLVNLYNSGASDEELFDAAVLFDESVNLFKASRMAGCEYGARYWQATIDYQEGKLESYVKWHPDTIQDSQNFTVNENNEKEMEWAKKTSESAWIYDMLMIEKMENNNILCHSVGLTYNHESKHLVYDSDNLTLIRIACPVDVIVKDENGKEFARISGGTVSAKAGYEHYFSADPTNKANDYKKTLLIPSNFTVDIKGTGNGTMDIFSRYIVNGVPSDTIQTFTNIPVESGSTGTLSKVLTSGGRQLDMDDSEYVSYDSDAITGVVISPSSIELHVGDESRCEGLLKPAGIKSYGLKWVSSNTAVAAVDNSGRITALSPGHADIAAYAPNGTVSNVCNVTVTGTASAVGDVVQIHRLYNQWAHTHLYLSNKAEIGQCVANGWEDEGVLWCAPAANSAEAAFKVVRLYNPYNGDHYYVGESDTTQLDQLLRLGWKRDSDASSFWSASQQGSYPIYTLFNPYNRVDTHLYTSQADEVDALMPLGWEQHSTIIWAAKLYS